MIATRFFEWPSFNFRGLGPAIVYGLSLLATQFFFLIQSQADVFIGGRVLNPHELGLYAEALFLTQIFVSKFIPPLNDVAFPAFARMQKDRDKVARSFCTAVRLLLLVACPIYFGMAVAAEPLIATLFGAKWLAMAPFVSILALAMPFMTLQVMFAPVSNALGRPGLTARISAIGAVIMPGAFLVGIGFGAVGLAWAWLLAYPLYTAITARLAGGAMGLKLADLIRAVAPGVGAAAMMAVLVYGVDAALPPLRSPVRLAALVGAGGIAYAAILLLFARGTVEELRRLILRRPATA
jgi:O-antigen/teichoic acid export membrane protein